MALKAAIAQHRLLSHEEVLSTSLDLSQHLYKMGLWTDKLGLVNSILQRLARAHLVTLMEDGKQLLIDLSQESDLHEGCAATRAVKAMVVKMFPEMKGWHSSEDFNKKTAFLDVQRNLQRWRREGAIWSMIQRRFSSLAILALVPHCIRVHPTGQSISGSS